MERIIVRIDDAADMLATSPNKVLNLIKQGLLPAYRDGRCWSIPISSIHKYAEERADAEAEGRRREWILNMK